MICHLRDNIHQIYWLHVTYRVCKEKSQIWFCKNEPRQEKFECYLLKLYSNFQKHKYVCFSFLDRNCMRFTKKQSNMLCMKDTTHCFQETPIPTWYTTNLQETTDWDEPWNQTCLLSTSTCAQLCKELGFTFLFFGIVLNQLVRFTCSGFRHVRSVLLNTNIRQTLCCCGPYS